MESNIFDVGKSSSLVVLELYSCLFISVKKMFSFLCVESVFMLLG